MEIFLRLRIAHIIGLSLSDDRDELIDALSRRFSSSSSSSFSRSSSTLPSLTLQQQLSAAAADLHATTMKRRGLEFKKLCEIALRKYILISFRGL